MSQESSTLCICNTCNNRSNFGGAAVKMFPMTILLRHNHPSQHAQLDEANRHRQKIHLKQDTIRTFGQFQPSLFQYTKKNVYKTPKIPVCSLTTSAFLFINNSVWFGTSANCIPLCKFYSTNYCLWHRFFQCSKSHLCIIILKLDCKEEKKTKNHFWLLFTASLRFYSQDMHEPHAGYKPGVPTGDQRET